MAALATAEFQKFQELRKEWRDCLFGEDRNSIWRQLSRMLWNSAAFQIVNEGRMSAPPRDEGGLQINGLVHGLINDGFFTMELVAIRRLLDAYGIRGKRAVFSISGLLKDMSENSRYVTREHILAVEELPYDPEPVIQARLEYVKQQIVAGKRAYGVPAHLMYERIERRHEDLDRLCGVVAQNRTPGDAIPAELFDWFLEKVSRVCADAIEHVNKFIAHAATPEDRIKVDVDKPKLTLQHLWDAHRVMVEVTNFLSVHILGGANFGGLAVPQYDQFEYIGQAIATREDVPRLQALWHDLDKEARLWTGWHLDELEAERQRNG